MQPAPRPEIDADRAWQALAARDARFDGQWFVGVTSTGIYCRPICRVRTPARRNCRFFATAAQAEAAAFRPCLKCRPEIAPGPGLPWTVMEASRTLAQQAAAALDAQAAGGAPPRLAELAARLGVSDRHLRRIFAATHGITPLQYLQTRRLLMAKQLLTDTALPVAQVALASGFRSVRRFNAAFAERYRLAPGALRRGREDTAPNAVAAGERIELLLAYRVPYDLEALLRFVGRRAIPGVEAVDGATIRRSVRAGVLAPQPLWLEARFEPERQRVRLAFAGSAAPASAAVLAAARRWLDLDAAPQAIDAVLAGLPGAPGLRLPGSLDAFELAVRAVLGQQVTVAAARTLARRLVERFGEPMASPWPHQVSCSFPPPALLARTPVERIAELGIVRQRAAAIVALAQAWPTLEAADGPQALIERLVALPGIGAWTAHYIAMRAFAWPDAFPPNDVAVLKAMQRLFAITTQRAADARAEAWRPWRAYAVLRLWNSLESPESPS